MNEQQDDNFWKNAFEQSNDAPRDEQLSLKDLDKQNGNDIITKAKVKLSNFYDRQKTIVQLSLVMLIGSFAFFLIMKPPFIYATEESDVKIRRISFMKLIGYPIVLSVVTFVILFIISKFGCKNISSQEDENSTK